MDITVTVGIASDSNRPRVRVDAVLPPGTTKTIVLPRRSSRWLCVVDRAGATFTSNPTTADCAGDRFQGPSNTGCSTRTVSGDPGDNGDRTGRHTITICLDSSKSYYTISGLLHTVVEAIPDEADVSSDPTDGPYVAPLPLRPADGGDETETGGCAAGGEATSPLMALLLALGLAVTARSRSTAARRARAPRSRR
jgi:hypothetical protein